MEREGTKERREIILETRILETRILNPDLVTDTQRSARCGTQKRGRNGRV
jgi:hypothetical protein